MLETLQSTLDIYVQTIVFSNIFNLLRCTPLETTVTVILVWNIHLGYIYILNLYIFTSCHSDVGFKEIGKIKKTSKHTDDDCKKEWLNSAIVYHMTTAISLAVRLHTWGLHINISFTTVFGDSLKHCWQQIFHSEYWFVCSWSGVLKGWDLKKGNDCTSQATGVLVCHTHQCIQYKNS